MNGANLRENGIGLNLKMDLSRIGFFEFNHDSEVPYGFWNDKKHGSVTHWANIEPPKEEA